MDTAQGIIPSELIVRTALVLALRELRAKPELVDECFRSLTVDSYTAAVYGPEANRAKEWFLSTPISVLFDLSSNPQWKAAISISLGSDGEDAVTLGDIHYDPLQRTQNELLTIQGPFNATSWDPDNSELEIPTTSTGSVPVVAGMILVDGQGNEFAITDVDGQIITPETDWIADTDGCTIKTSSSPKAQGLESLSSKISFSIGTHVIGDPLQGIWLRMLVKYILLRYKEVLFEGRGFERMTHSWGPFAKDERFGVERCYTSYATLEGFVRETWSKPSSFIPTAYSTETTYTAPNIDTVSAEVPLVVDISSDSE